MRVGVNGMTGALLVMVLPGGLLAGWDAGAAASAGDSLPPRRRHAAFAGLRLRLQHHRGPLLNRASGAADWGRRVHGHALPPQ